MQTDTLDNLTSKIRLPATASYMSVLRDIHIPAGNKSSASRENWTDKHICDYLDNVNDRRVTVTCGIDLILPPCLFIVGIISNVLVVLVMQTRSFRSISTSFYMMVNAVTDSASLLVALPAHYIFVNYPHVFDTTRDAHAMCSFFNFFGWATSDLGILFTVAMTTERAIAVKYPLKAYKLCTKRRAKHVVACLTVFEFIKVSHFFFKSRVVSDTNSRLCDTDKNDVIYAKFYSSVWPWLHFTILCISYSLAVIGNVVIFVNIRRSCKGFTSDGTCHRRTGQDITPGSKNRHISLMLLIDSITLVMCTLPFSVFGIVTSQTSLISDSPGGKNLPFTVTFYLLYLNRCLNFFLYCLSGSRFRAALKDIFLHTSHSLVLNVSPVRRNRSVSVSCRSEAEHPDHADRAEQCGLAFRHSLTHEVSASIEIQGKVKSPTCQHLLTLPIFLTLTSAQSVMSTSNKMMIRIQRMNRFS